MHPGPTPIWLKRFKAFKAYVAKYGDYPTYDHAPELNKWVITQRRRYRNRFKYRGMSQKLIDILDNYGFQWESHHERLWREKYELLKVYLDEHITFYISKYNTVYSELREWIQKQRAAKTKGTLSEERYRKLEQLGFIWNAPDVAWEEHFEKLRLFVNRHQKYPSIDEDKSTYEWYTVQRKKHKLGKLSKWQLKYLNSLSITWQPKIDKQWQQHLNNLITHIDTHKDYPNPETNKLLSTWVFKQRYKYKQGKMPSEQFEQLNNMGFAWDIKAWRWQNAFVRFKRYYTKHKETPKRKNNYELWYWVYVQRHNKLKNKLTPEQIEQLNAINFDWRIPPNSGKATSKAYKNSRPNTK